MELRQQCCRGNSVLAICAGSLFANATVQIIGNMNTQAMVTKTINIIYLYIYISIRLCVYIYTWIHIYQYVR